MKKYYLAYGSNLNLDQMLLRCPDTIPVGTTNLKNYRLVYKGAEKHYGYLTIEQCEQSTVPVAIYEISIIDEYRLDIYEGFPTLYTKVEVEIELDNEKVSALIYVMNPIFDYQIPREDYIQICEEGYSDWGFDNSHLHNALNITKENIAKKLTK